MCTSTIREEIILSSLALIPRLTLSAFLLRPCEEEEGGDKARPSLSDSLVLSLTYSHPTHPGQSKVREECSNGGGQSEHQQVLLSGRLVVALNRVNWIL